MNITKKFDRAFQWAGEKMGAEAKTSMPDDFKSLETEMSLRHDGMDRLQRSMTAYVKWIGRRGEVFDDREKGLPISYLGRTMAAHGEDFEPDSEFGNCLVSLGRANERLAAAQEQYVADATAAWLESLERNLAMMKEYQAARKKLESRRLAYDASITRMQKAKRDDFRIEEELRANRAKYEESSEDVVRRMQDIKDAEVDSIRDLTSFLDCELEFHERCADELRRVKRSWPGAATAAAAANNGGGASSGLGGGLGGGLGVGFGGGRRSRSNTARSYNERALPSYGSNMGGGGGGGGSNGGSYIEEEPEPQPVRMPIRSNTRLGNSGTASPEKPPRPTIGRSSSFQQQGTSDRYGDRYDDRYGDRNNGDRNNGGRFNGDRDRNDRYGASSPFSGNNSNGATPASTATAAVSTLRNGLRPVGRIQTNGHGNVFADDADDTASGSGGSGGSGGGTGSPERSASPATSFGSLSRSTSNLAARKAPPPPPPVRNKKPPPPVPARRETAS